MSVIRAQYHFRKTNTGIDAWDVRRLIDLSKDFPIMRLNPASMDELYLDHWYFDGTTVPSPINIIEHIQLIQECDLNYPIILDSQGRVMDGMHRICRAILGEIEEISAVQFSHDPLPDFVDCNPEDLPYDA